MDPTARGGAAETLAVLDRLDALYGQLAPLERQYRDWAREYQQTGVPHDQSEFGDLQARIHAIRQRIGDARAALRALAAPGGAR